MIIWAKITQFFENKKNLVQFGYNKDIMGLSQLSKNINKIIELKEYLYRLNIPNNTFAIMDDIGQANDAICISCEDYQEKNIFYVFYSERGNRYDVVSFLDEKDACQFFLYSLKKLLYSGTITRHIANKL